MTGRETVASRYHTLLPGSSIKKDVRFFFSFFFHPRCLYLPISLCNLFRGLMGCSEKCSFLAAQLIYQSEIKKSPESVLNTCYRTPLSCKLNCTQFCVLNAHLIKKQKNNLNSLFWLCQRHSFIVMCLLQI